MLGGSTVNEQTVRVLGIKPSLGLAGDKYCPWHDDYCFFPSRNGFFVGGAFYFRRMEKTFADVVKQTCSHVPMLVESKVLNGKHYNMCVGCNCSWAYKPEKIGEGGWHHELVSGSM